MMGRRTSILMAAAATALVSAPGPAAAQDQETQDRSALIRFVEKQLSAPNRQIRLNGIRGTLSSNVTFDSITVADRDGVWLRIVEPNLTWQRTALLTGSLNIESLTAQRIEWPRMPAADDSLPAPETSGFTIPELPIDIRIGNLGVGEAVFGEPVFGLASVLALDGRLEMADGEFSTELEIVRRDGPGGEMSMRFGYSQSTGDVSVNFNLSEPGDGVIANVLSIPDRPPVSLRIDGSGPVDELRVDLAFDAAGSRVAAGELVLDRDRPADGLRARFDLAGPIGSILPEQHRAFFGASTSLSGALLVPDGGGLDLTRLDVRSDALTITGKASTYPDGFPRRVSVAIDLGTAGENAVRLPLAGDPVTVGGGKLTFNYDAEVAGRWFLRGGVENVRSSTAEIDAIEVEGDGLIIHPSQAGHRAVTFHLDVNAKGYRPEDAGLAVAIGQTPALSAYGGWKTGRTIDFNDVLLTTDAFFAFAQGSIEDSRLVGTANAQTSDLGAFSKIAGRTLGGEAELSLDGEIGLLGSGFDVALKGSLKDLAVGDAAANRLFAGTTQFSGRAARGPDGLSFEQLKLSNAQAVVTLDGTYATEVADLRAEAMLNSLATLSEDAEGALAISATIDKPQGSQEGDPYELSATAAIGEGRMRGHAVRNIAASFAGTADDAVLDGAVSASGTIGGDKIDLEATVRRSADVLAVRDLTASVGSSRIIGDLRLSEGGTDGSLVVRSTDISKMAALALVDAAGSVAATIALTTEEGRQDASARISAGELTIRGYEVGRATIEAELRDLGGIPQIDADVTATGVAGAGIRASTLEATANTSGETTLFDATATLDSEAEVETRGSLTQTAAGYEAEIEKLTIASKFGDARLSRPARLVRSADALRIDTFAAEIAGGTLEASGIVSDVMSVDVSVDRIPLSAANGFRPDLGLDGTVSGDVAVSGPSGEPQVQWRVRASALEAAPTRAAGIAPIDARGSGSYADNRLTIDELKLANSQNLDLSGSGTVPLAGTGMSVRINGSAPLGLAETVLADRGTRLSGIVRLDAALTGTLTAPKAEGLFSLTGATVTDPVANLRLTGLNAAAGLRGDTISINSASAQLGDGGSISAGGTVGLTAQLPADLRIGLRDAVYSDAQTIKTRLSGDLSVTGPLAAGPQISGSIDLEETEIAIPESFGAAADLLDVSHVGADTPTLRTLRRLEAVIPKSRTGGRHSPLRLDVALNAPNRIFVRGRGIDAELGGRVRLTGSLSDIEPVGSFDLIRGRVVVLNKRLDLTEGQISLTGSLDPLVDLTAEVQEDDIDAFIELSGRSSDLTLRLSSSPDLPEDEILARVLFGESIANLSPVQIANLATAAAGLAGGGGGLAGQLRSGIGVDNLDLREDDQGRFAVRAGTYLRDNVYLDIQAGAAGGEASINLDVTDSLTARGTVETDGDSRLGIFFERDY